jgi:heme iron utilization protein
MDPAQTHALRALLQRQEVASLGTVRRDEPFVSMVPYALLDDGAFVVHVSRLATHTRDMEEHPGVSLMVVAGRQPDVPAQAVPRATLQANALPCPTGSPRYDEARAAYLARFPDTEFMFGFADFSLFMIVPRSVRFVAGFAQAGSLTAEAYVQLMAPPAAGA